MLGDPDPEVRERTALPALTAWLRRGVYDDLLAGLGDGIAAGLRAGLGETGTDSVLRRSASAQLLAACIERDNQRPLTTGGKVLEWGDRLAAWLLREQDLRSRVPGGAQAEALGHGADAMTVLARSPHLAKPELTVVLDVIADRVVAPVPTPYLLSDSDRLASATMAVLRRNLIPLSLAEPWIARISAVAQGASAPPADGDETAVRADAEAFLRSLYLQLALGHRPPQIRADLLLVVVEALKAGNGFLRR